MREWRPSRISRDESSRAPPRCDFASGECFLLTLLGLCIAGGFMVVLVMVEEPPDHSPVLAQVSSVPSPLSNERPSRDVVTLYGVPSAESLALALAAALESRRAAGAGEGHPDAGRHPPPARGGTKKRPFVFVGPPPRGGGGGGGRQTRPPPRALANCNSELT